MAKIEPVSTMEAFQNADVVVEAVYENLDLKKQIFETLDGIMKPGALLATNTSGLDVDAIAASTSPRICLWYAFFQSSQCDAFA